MQPNIDMPLAGWIALALILLTQGILLFLDAGRKGANRWFWGIWGLIQIPMPALLYWLFVIRPYQKRRRDK